MFLRLVALILGLWSLTPTMCDHTDSKNVVLGVPILSAPDASFVKSIETFSCSLSNPPKEESILYTLYGNNGTKKHGDFSAHGEYTANFTLVIQLSYDGLFYCNASVQNNTAIQPVKSKDHYFRVIVPVEGAELSSDPSPAEVFEGQNLTLSCSVKAGTDISYTWLISNSSVEARHRQEGNRLLLVSVTSEDAGNYSCLAWNQLIDSVHSSISTQKLVTVKVGVSKLNISFSVQKNGTGYLAQVRCQAGRGTLPINFTLYHENGEQQGSEETHSHQASFPIPVELNRHMGALHCVAENGHRRVRSDVLPLRVVPVGGSVRLTLEHDDSGSSDRVSVRLRCAVDRGTFPQFHWFLNDSGLDSRGPFHRIEEHSRSLLLTSVNDHNSGSYHLASRVPVTVLSVVLGCFLFLCSLVTGCCIYGALHRRRPAPRKRAWILNSTAMNNMEYEDDELVEDEYMEDGDLATAANMEDRDTVEGESLDEWEQIEKALQINCMDEEVPPS
ncbi:Fc receptor-like protein 5 isoform X2 [Megalops cyprinoides]|uniref:Fc receptor-like protein 5 isoform X2 n=1 Tax=Megalops cyprinoides TaxID=118141 RepID=UPI00186509BC|nr:Fc receptor-like protein 5 isoform X2 [Megalops cyprinoides]